MDSDEWDEERPRWHENRGPLTPQPLYPEQLQFSYILVSTKQSGVWGRWVGWQVVILLLIKNIKSYLGSIRPNLTATGKLISSQLCSGNVFMLTYFFPVCFPAAFWWCSEAHLDLYRGFYIVFGDLFSAFMVAPNWLQVHLSYIKALVQYNCAYSYNLSVRDEREWSHNWQK